MGNMGEFWENVGENMRNRGNMRNMGNRGSGDPVIGGNECVTTRESFLADSKIKSGSISKIQVVRPGYVIKVLDTSGTAWICDQSTRYKWYGLDMWSKYSIQVVRPGYVIKVLDTSGTALICYWSIQYKWYGLDMLSKYSTKVPYHYVIEYFDNISRPYHFYRILR